LLLRWVNNGFQTIASLENWTWLEGQKVLTYGTHGAGANTADGITYLPHDIHRLVSVWPSGRGYREQVEIIGGWELDSRDPSMVAGSPADVLALWGYYNVARDNPTAGVINVADAGGAAFDVVVEGTDTNGFEARETVTLVAGAGVTTTTFAAGPDGVRRCYILEDSITAGVPTIVTFVSTGTTIETLNYTNGEFIHEHRRTELSPATTGGASYVTRYQKRVRPVTSVNDVVAIPFEFEDLLTLSIERRLLAFQGKQQEALAHEQMFRNRVRELK
ncbi:unnamed protein product, partial [marine sediment metagenome]